MSSTLAGAGDIQLGTLSEWIASGLTFVAVALALWQAWRTRQNDQRRNERHQAELVAAWHARDESTSGADPRGTTVLAVRNGSEQPVYDVLVFLAPIQGAIPHTGEEWIKLGPQHATNVMRALPVLPPGSWEVDVAGGWYVHQARGAAEVAFTDAHRRHWIRRNDGDLESIKQPAAEHYGVARPLDYGTPRAS